MTNLPWDGVEQRLGVLVPWVVENIGGGAVFDDIAGRITATVSLMLFVQHRRLHNLAKSFCRTEHVSGHGVGLV